MMSYRITDQKFTWHGSSSGNGDLETPTTVETDVVSLDVEVTFLYPDIKDNSTDSNKHTIIVPVVSDAITTVYSVSGDSKSITSVTVNIPDPLPQISDYATEIADAIDTEIEQIDLRTKYRTALNIIKSLRD